MLSVCTYVKHECILLRMLVCTYLWTHVCLFVCLFACLRVALPISASVYPVCLRYVYLFVCPSVCACKFFTVNPFGRRQGIVWIAEVYIVQALTNFSRIAILQKVFFRVFGVPSFNSSKSICFLFLHDSVE